VKLKRKKRPKIVIFKECIVLDTSNKRASREHQESNKKATREQQESNKRATREQQESNNYEL
jgi:prophage tail gpP-like protein